MSASIPGLPSAETCIVGGQWASDGKSRAFNHTTSFLNSWTSFCCQLYFLHINDWASIDHPTWPEHLKWCVCLILDALSLLPTLITHHNLLFTLPSSWPSLSLQLSQVPGCQMTWVRAFQPDRQSAKWRLFSHHRLLEFIWFSSIFETFTDFIFTAFKCWFH